jgi:hypothetical protein
MNLVKGTIYRFRNRENAFNFSIWVILGDDDYFWAVLLLPTSQGSRKQAIP